MPTTQSPSCTPRRTPPASTPAAAVPNTASHHGRAPRNRVIGFKMSRVRKLLRFPVPPMTGTLQKWYRCCSSHAAPVFTGLSIENDQFVGNAPTPKP